MREVLIFSLYRFGLVLGIETAAFTRNSVVLGLLGLALAVDTLVILTWRARRKK